MDWKEMCKCGQTVNRRAVVSEPYKEQAKFYFCIQVESVLLPLQPSHSMTGSEIGLPILLKQFLLLIEMVA